MPNETIVLPYTYESSYSGSKVQTDSKLVLLQSKNGEPLKGFRKVIRNHGNATTRFTGSRQSFDSVMPPFVEAHFIGDQGLPPIYIKGTGFAPGVVQMYPHFGTFPSSFSADRAENTARGKFYESCAAAESPAQGQVMLGEIRETLELIHHPTRALFGLYHSLLDQYANVAKRYKGRRLTKKYLNQAISDVYLQHVFAVLPLINDIKDAVKAYDRAVAARKFLDVSGFGHETKAITSFDFEYNNWDTSLPVNCHETHTAEIMVIYRGVVRLDASGPTSARLGKALGFSFSSFVPSMWELIPYSFLADYFGTFSEVITSQFGVQPNIAWVCRTQRNIAAIDCQGYVEPKPPGNYRVKSCTGLYNWRTTTTTVDRSPFVHDVPKPEFQFEIPSFGLKWLNMGALVLKSRNVTRLFSKLL